MDGASPKLCRYLLGASLASAGLAHFASVAISAWSALFGPALVLHAIWTLLSLMRVLLFAPWCVEAAIAKLASAMGSFTLVLQCLYTRLPNLG